MPIQHLIPEPLRRRGRSRRLPLLTLLPALLMWLASATPAFAEGCEDCPAPSMADVASQAGFSLELRSGLFGQSRDYVQMDRGECSGTLAEPPDIVRLRSWLVLRATGEVFNCPSAQSSTSVSVETSQSDSSSWSLTVKGSFKLKTLAAEVSAEIAQGNTTGVTITEVTRIVQTISAGYCRRIPWNAYFEVGEFKATALFSFTQHWAWWTKNAATGATVHAKGDIYVACGSSPVELERHAPIQGYLRLYQRSCSDAECAPRPLEDLGFFPPLPPHLLEPDAGGASTGADAPPRVEENAGEEEAPQTNGEPEAPPSEEGEPALPSSEDLGDAPSGPLPDPQQDLD